MSKTNSDKKPQEVHEMRAEYDFSKGVRGKHHEAYREGHTVKVHRANGTVVEQHFTLEEGAVLLEPDVRRYFPDSESVNNALRTLIKLIPPRRRERAKSG